MARKKREQGITTNQIEAIANAIRPLIANENWSLARNTLGAFLGYSHGGARDLYAAFGYERTVLTESLYELYMRNDIASRIIRAFPQATWREAPSVIDSAADGEDETPFSKAAAKFIEKNRILRKLERADRLASIGRFGVLVMGFKDGKPMSEPLVGKAPLLYLAPYSEVSAKVAQWDMDTTSPRYRMPLTYRIQSKELENGQPGVKVPNNAFTVHHTRVIHISEFLDQDDTFGQPRLLPVYNRLKDLEKVVGGSAETFWNVANRGTIFSVDKEAVISDTGKADLKEQAAEFAHGLRRQMVGQGITAQVLGSDDPDPQLNANVLLDLISGAVGIPKRILLGTERGELASGQDENNWASRIHERRATFAGPSVMHPFIQRMIETGNLPAPMVDEDGDFSFSVEWEEEEALSPDAQSTIMNNKTTALANYANSPSAPMIVPPGEFREAFLGLPAETEYEQVEDPSLEEPLPEDDPNAEGDPSEQDPEQSAEDGADPQPPGRRATEDDDEEPSPSNNQLAGVKAPLYVWRRVTNPAQLQEWAAKNGLGQLDADLHVTVICSREPVDWGMIGAERDPYMLLPGWGRRRFEVLGSKLVLLFDSDGLTFRNRQASSLGAKWDFGAFRPHVSLRDAAGLTPAQIAKLDMYNGAISFGAEEQREFTEKSEAV